MTWIKRYFSTKSLTELYEKVQETQPEELIYFSAGNYATLPEASRFFCRSVKYIKALAEKNECFALHNLKMKIDMPKFYKSYSKEIEGRYKLLLKYQDLMRFEVKFGKELEALKNYEIPNNLRTVFRLLKAISPKESTTMRKHLMRKIISDMKLKSVITEGAKEYEG